MDVFALPKTAILVDGAFYRKRAAFCWGQLSAEARAKELNAYCQAHLSIGSSNDRRSLYRVFYYDCPPLNCNVYHPLLGRTVYLARTDTYTWMNAFLRELRKLRKFALRLGNLSEDFLDFSLKLDATKGLCSGTIRIDDLQEKDFELNTVQKGVDMKIAVDIASMTFKQQVDQMILISGDSDFVPAAKLARREGIDFILDPMWQQVKGDLYEHIDGLRSPWKARPKNPPSI